jgi:hypothetical protein
VIDYDQEAARLCSSRTLNSRCPVAARREGNKSHLRAHRLHRRISGTFAAGEEASSLTMKIDKGYRGETIVRPGIK